MRVSTLLLALPALAAAADQVPLKEKATGWFNKAKAYVPVPSAPSVPVEAAASKVAAKRVHKFTHANYGQKLTPVSQDPTTGSHEDWLIFVTGGNKTCFGRCGEVEKTWNESVPILSTIPNSPNLGIIDCERQGLLCTTWAAGIPSLYYFQIPVTAPGQDRPLTPLYIKPLNGTHAKISDIVSFITEKGYAATKTDAKTGEVSEMWRYDGLYHPINGQLKVFGLLEPLGYIMWGLSQIPSFVFMILISFVSRNIMGRRMGGQGGAGGPAAPAAGASRPAAK